MSYHSTIFPAALRITDCLNNESYYDPIIINPQGIIIGNNNQKIIANSFLYYYNPGYKEHLDKKYKDDRRYGKYLLKKYG